MELFLSFLEKSENLRAVIVNMLKIPFFFLFFFWPLLVILSSSFFDERKCTAEARDTVYLDT